ncbi:hypothetical protein AMTR_s00028p00234490 [Amborella trichopoda]|uniref:Uncharacterized protein n=1 Tax=Amborella trichopoda TaxID=13333 RepID=W1PL04_AMBTC|nr:hypothetical protein AMTR_s00028p00234490 [Amborella trichopoda]
MSGKEATICKWVVGIRRSSYGNQAGRRMDGRKECRGSKPRDGEKVGQRDPTRRIGPRWRMATGSDHHDYKGGGGDNDGPQDQEARIGPRHMKAAVTGYWAGERHLAGMARVGEVGRGSRTCQRQNRPRLFHFTVVHSRQTTGHNGHVWEQGRVERRGPKHGGQMGGDLGLGDYETIEELVELKPKGGGDEMRDEGVD